MYFWSQRQLCQLTEGTIKSRRITRSDLCPLITSTCFIAIYYSASNTKLICHLCQSFHLQLDSVTTTEQLRRTVSGGSFEFLIDCGYSKPLWDCVLDDKKEMLERVILHCFTLPQSCICPWDGVGMHINTLKVDLEMTSISLQVVTRHLITGSFPNTMPPKLLLWKNKSLRSFYHLHPK